MADRTPEQFSPTENCALACAQGEPLPFRATTSTVLTGAMWVDFHRDRRLGVGFLTGEPIDLPSQLVGLFAIEPSGLACLLGLDRA